MDALLELLSHLIAETVWFAPLLAFLAGVLTSITPCSLTSIPLIIGYVGGTNTFSDENHQISKRALWLSVTFAIGSAVTFTLLGVIATMAGTLMGMSSMWWYVALGVLMLMMALQTWGLFEFIPANNLLLKNPKKGFVGAFIAGILGGIFSSPCSTPVLIALLAIVADQSSFVWGILLLLCYSVGHGILAIICGTSVGVMNKLLHNPQYAKLSNAIKIIMGLFITLIGFYMFHLAFQ